MNSTAMAKAKAEIEKHLQILDKHLYGKTYLVAEQFSLAEVCCMPFPGFPAANGNQSLSGSNVVEPAPTRAAECGCHSAGEVAQRQPAGFIDIAGDRISD